MTRTREEILEVLRHTPGRPMSDWLKQSIEQNEAIFGLADLELEIEDCKQSLEALYQTPGLSRQLVDEITARIEALLSPLSGDANQAVQLTLELHILERKASMIEAQLKGIHHGDEVLITSSES